MPCRLKTYKERAAVSETEQALTKSMDTIDHACIACVPSKEDKALLVLVSHQLIVDQADFLSTMNRSFYR